MSTQDERDMADTQAVDAVDAGPGPYDQAAAAGGLPAPLPAPSGGALPFRGATGDVVCPQCSTPNPDPGGRRSGDAFCRECDFPLFFTSGVVQRVDQNSDDALWRRPGVAGRERRTWIGCPACAELNPRDALNCLRCGAVLRPIVLEPAVEQRITVEPLVVTSPVRPCKRWPAFVFGLATGLVVSALAIVIAWVVWG